MSVRHLAGHLIFHSGDHGGLTGIDLVAALTSLSLGVLPPGALLMLNRRRSA
ncbi:hypothetical protein [Micromonospora sp. NPDC049679]|uniref:hypothetical protein n=1 Tax=Micromonospora sp. NPDC049679 TaxID=3155920 RepID=UPI0033CA9696